MKDNVKPSGPWRFDYEVAECFDDMLERSIPQYQTMRQLVSFMAHEFLPVNGTMVDIGSSLGGTIASVRELYPEGVPMFIGLERSVPMMELARDRFEGDDEVVLMQWDCEFGLPEFKASVITCVLTLQFIPPHKRQELLDTAYQRIRPGGAFILVEKVTGVTPRIDRQMVERYHDLKNANGYSREQIAAKAESLEGVLRPVTARHNDLMLYRAGFDIVDCFWRWMNFAAFVAVKEDKR